MKRKCCRKLWRRTTTSARWQRRSSIRRWRPTKRTAQHLWQLWMRSSRRRSVLHLQSCLTCTSLATNSTLWFLFSFLSLTGQEVGRGAKEQGNHQRRNFGRLKVAPGGLYRVFYVSKDWFIFCSASIFVVFTTHLFEINTSSTLWIFSILLL